MHNSHGWACNGGGLHFFLWHKPTPENPYFFQETTVPLPATLLHGWVLGLGLGRRGIWLGGGGRSGPGQGAGSAARAGLRQVAAAAASERQALAVGERPCFRCRWLGACATQKSHKDAECDFIVA